MSAPATVWFVVPDGFDEPGRVSGGNVYDQRVTDALRALGADVRLVEAAPDSPPDLAMIPDGGHVVIDGLVAIGSPWAIEEAASRLRVVVLAHMLAAAFPDPGSQAVAAERQVLSCARRVITASRWLRDELEDRGLVPGERLAVAAPGSDPAPISAGTTPGGSLLCVGVVASHKGQDTLVEALTRIRDVPPWTCTFAGSLTVEPAFAKRVAAGAATAGLSERITWAGVLSPRELDAAYAKADLLIAPSRTETYGIAIGDALSRGIPVLASNVGGIPEAAQPPEAVALVAPGDPAALGDALRRWREDPWVRATMSTAARRAAPGRRRWSDTARDFRRALEALS